MKLNRNQSAEQCSASEGGEVEAWIQAACQQNYQYASATATGYVTKLLAREWEYGLIATDQLPSVLKAKPCSFLMTYVIKALIFGNVLN